MSEGRAAVWEVTTCIVELGAVGGRGDDGPGSAVVVLCGTSVTTGGMRWQRCERLVRVFRQLESDVSN